jgi:hypothetical protein
MITQNRYLRFPDSGSGVVIPPSLDLVNLLSYYESGSVDPTAILENDIISSWDDAKGVNHGTQTGTQRPELHIGTSGGARQVSFDGIEDWLNIGKPSNLNFIPQTDEFSIVARIGDTKPTQGYIISKADATSGLRQWGLYIGSSTQFGVVLGGVTETFNTGFSPNALIILTVSTTTITLNVDGVDLGGEAITGTATSDVDVNIGGRSNGGYLFDGDQDFISVFSGVLSAGEITDIVTDLKIN